MGIPSRAFLATAAAVLAFAPLRAESGTWSAGVGAVFASGGSKQWLGNPVGPAVDIFESYPLSSQDTIRMRFGYWALKASSSNPDVATVPGGAPTTYPASTTNQLFGFTYGGEYVRYLPARLYALGGLGVTYISATRQGTWNLSASGLGSASASYSANNFVPYVCLGLGAEFTRSLSLEARWQTASMKAQNRPFDLSSISGGTGSIAFPKLTASTLSVGLVLKF